LKKKAPNAKSATSAFLAFADCLQNKHKQPSLEFLVIPLNLLLPHSLKQTINGTNEGC